MSFKQVGNAFTRAKQVDTLGAEDYQQKKGS